METEIQGVADDASGDICGDVMPGMLERSEYFSPLRTAALWRRCCNPPCVSLDPIPLAWN